MVTAVIVLGWLACTLVASRKLYQKWRPSTEPIHCTTPYACSRKHHSFCYGSLDKGEAAVFSALLALFGPLSLAGFGWYHLMTAKAPLRSEEKDAALKKALKDLEATNEQLRKLGVEI